MESICRKMTFQINGHNFSGKYPLSVINCVFKFKRLYDWSNIQKDVAIRLFRNFMSSPALPRLMGDFLVCNGAKMYESKILLYAWVLNHLWKRYCTDAMIPEDDEENTNFK